MIPVIRLHDIAVHSFIKVQIRFGIIFILK